MSKSKSVDLTSDGRVTLDHPLKTTSFFNRGMDCSFDTLLWVLHFLGIGLLDCDIRASPNDKLQVLAWDLLRMRWAKMTQDELHKRRNEIREIYEGKNDPSAGLSHLDVFDRLVGGLESTSIVHRVLYGCANKNCPTGRHRDVTHSSLWVTNEGHKDFVDGVRDFWGAVEASFDNKESIKGSCELCGGRQTRMRRVHGELPRRYVVERPSWSSATLGKPRGNFRYYTVEGEKFRAHYRIGAYIISTEQHVFAHLLQYNDGGEITEIIEYDDLRRMGTPRAVDIAHAQRMLKDGGGASMAFLERESLEPL